MPFQSTHKKGRCLTSSPPAKKRPSDSRMYQRVLAESQSRERGTTVCGKEPSQATNPASAFLLRKRCGCVSLDSSWGERLMLNQRLAC